MKTVFAFILNWFLLASINIVAKIFLDKLFHNTKELIITPINLVDSLVFGLIAATYFLFGGK
jgi:hypothetical protein